jgi:hypothetical protein
MATTTTNKDGSGNGNNIKSNTNSDNSTEKPATSLDPAVALWYECLEEARVKGFPRGVVADPQLVESIWQKNFIHSKRMYCHYFGGDMARC